MADRSSYPSEQADKYLLRLPEGMRDQLKSAAAQNNRSMNAEIVARLQDSFEKKTPESDALVFHTKVVNSALEQFDSAASDIIAIDDWAMENGIRNRADALRRLANMALLLDEAISPMALRCQALLRTYEEMGVALSKVELVSEDPSGEKDVQKAIDDLFYCIASVGTSLTSLLRPVFAYREVADFTEAKRLAVDESGELDEMIKEFADLTARHSRDRIS
ncbi:Arc family DNA-binding protein [Devosia sp. BSSL-BM10]|uniref:Arc family DNA-binding protein n=1 Tax=Devosia litorisediminis TaxID=2829817 RepID=A0A942I612_9HYPH|nr:Arc family DNA-binding protein [Devosia litorisediminis]MBS3849711.1 Arc family DNA-binding protein [Devosia litorisediminis]